MTQQLVDRYGAGQVFGGGLEITTTLDLEIQKAAEQAIYGRLNGVGPSASLVAIENKTGEVKAMVGGNDFDKKPFNLATNGHRQPGLVVQAVHPGRGAQAGLQPQPDLHLAEEDLRRPGLQGREVRGEQLRGLLRRRHDARARDRRRRTTRCTPSSA